MSDLYWRLQWRADRRAIVNAHTDLPLLFYLLLKYCGLKHDDNWLKIAKILWFSRMMFFTDSTKKIAANTKAFPFWERFIAFSQRTKQGRNSTHRRSYESVTPQNVIVTQNVITIAAKCNNNAKCNKIDAKCNKVVNAKCNNFFNAKCNKFSNALCNNAKCNNSKIYKYFEIVQQTHWPLLFVGFTHIQHYRDIGIPLLCFNKSPCLTQLTD